MSDFSTTAPITGLHHVTAIAGNPQRNLDFYTGVLGLRLVKLTVNFDDPGTYHFYFGDRMGHPGTIITFFPWANAAPGRIGAGQATVTTYSVPPDSLGYWRERLAAQNIETAPLSDHFGEEGLTFTDPDGMRLELIADANAASEDVWDGSEVPAEFALRRFHSVTLTENSLDRTAKMLTETMDWTLEKSDDNRYRFAPAKDAGGTRVDVLILPHAAPGRMGAGIVHHIAFRVPSDDAQEIRHAQLKRLGSDVSPTMDRFYFHSIYFHEPGGVLFEIATDPPGFTTDETLEELGTSLKLPEQYEPRRASIESIVAPLVLPSAKKGTV